MSGSEKFSQKKDETVGQAKEAWGKMTDEEQQQSKGRNKKSKNKAQQGKERASGAIDKAKESGSEMTDRSR